MRYETEGMSKLRSILKQQGFDDHYIDTWKAGLIALERKGFTLKGPNL